MQLHQLFPNMLSFSPTTSRSLLIDIVVCFLEIFHSSSANFAPTRTTDSWALRSRWSGWLYRDGTARERVGWVSPSPLIIPHWTLLKLRRRLVPPCSRRSIRWCARLSSLCYLLLIFRLSVLSLYSALTCRCSTYLTLLLTYNGINIKDLG